jgi:hypothetical protein
MKESHKMVIKRVSIAVGGGNEEGKKRGGGGGERHCGN